MAGLVTSFEILHLSGVAVRDPLRKVSEFVEVAHGSNPGEVEALIARGALYEIGDVVDSRHAKRGGVSAVTRHVKSKLQRLMPHSQQARLARLKPCASQILNSFGGVLGRSATEMIFFACLAVKSFQEILKGRGRRDLAQRKQRKSLRRMEFCSRAS